MTGRGATERVAIRPGRMTLSDWRAVACQGRPVGLATDWMDAVSASVAAVARVEASDRPTYGINTGFGLLAHTRIPTDQLADLQRRIVLSHCAGTGPDLPDDTVRLIVALKANALARGYSGVRPVLIDYLMAMLDRDLLPCIPAQGSVGASGDLAPLAHMSAVLLGLGDVRLGGVRMPAAEGLTKIGLAPLSLGPKEGLALLNGTQVSTSLALVGLFAAEDALAAAVVAGAMSVDAAKGSDVPFDERIQQLRGQSGQQALAACYRRLLEGSEIRRSHLNCDRVQDPYSLRCQPQVMGACLDHIRFAANVFEIEANAVSDNPIVFSETGEILSGGNFHAEPIAMAADTLALAIAEIGAMSERRIALLTDPHFSGLPAFLVRNGGLNSGFMIAQVTAAALASENKQLAHPASIDSLPTSANQEDHVSMATHSARRLAAMAENTAGIVGIELLAAAQGIDLRAPLMTSPVLQEAHREIRRVVPHYDEDRYFAPDIAAAKALIRSGTFNRFASMLMPSMAGP